MSYLPCELHFHTNHSDGAFTPTELQNAARDNALSLIALTDHNTTSGAAELSPDIIPVIRGIEWTTYFGHMLVLGADSFIDWRNATPDNIDEKIKEAKNANAVVGIAHPFQLGSPMCTGGRWEFNIRDWQQVDYIEVWHDRFFTESYENSRSLELWTKLLDEGYHIAATYGRDWHSDKSKGHFCCTYLNFDGQPNAESALNAIKSGRTVISTGAKFFFKAVQSDRVYDIGDTLPAGKTELRFFTDEYARRLQNPTSKIIHKKIKLVSNGGECVLESSLTQSASTIEFEANRWYRAELWGSFDDAETLLAVTSPVYTE